MATKPVKKDAKDKKPARIKVTGFAPLKLGDFTITQKSSGRFAVVTSKGLPVNGDAKVKVLLDAKILKPSMPKPAAPVETPTT